MQAETTASKTAIARAQDTRGIKTSYIARKLGVSCVTVRSWRAGVTRPRPSKALGLVEILKPELKLEDIYSGDEG